MPFPSLFNLFGKAISSHKILISGLWVLKSVKNINSNIHIRWLFAYQEAMELLSQSKQK